MASSPTDLPVQYFEASDGVRLAWRDLGQGRPVILIHGYISDVQTNWIRYGSAGAIAAEGFRVIMPDLRGHGDSAKPHDPDAYPPDILADDGFALIAHLGLTDYDLGGYSLGARTTARMLVRGAKPRRAIIAGMGLDGLTATKPRSAHFHELFAKLGKHEHGSPLWMAEAFLKTVGGDPVALELVLGTFVDTSRRELAALDLPVLMLSGDEDRDNGSATELAEVLPQGQLVEVPGNHMSVATRPEFGAAIVRFLTS